MFIIKVLIIWMLLFPTLGFCLWFSNGMMGSYLAELKAGFRPYVAMTLLFVAVFSAIYFIL